MNIRECNLNDIEKWVDLNQEFMKYEIVDEVFWSNMLDSKKDDLRKLFIEALEDKSHITLMMIEHDEEVIGFMNLMTIFSIWAGGKSLTLDDFFIIEEYRGMGIGKNVMEYLEGYAKRNGYKRFQFLSEHSNELAHKFYTKLGYESEYMHFYIKYL